MSEEKAMGTAGSLTRRAAATALVGGLAFGAVAAGGSAVTAAPPSGGARPGLAAFATPAGATTLLRAGDRGPQVRTLQRRLLDLGYWNSGTEGVYGLTTQQAVMALQKAAGLSRDGVYGPASRRALSAGIRPRAHSRHGHVLEIDRTRQIALFVTNGRVESVLNTSTGKPGWTTPLGHFRIFREVNALDRGPLGDLWRPKFFYRGIAIHGSGSIPGYPASHGCARVSNPAIDWVWARNRAPVGTPVWVYS